MSRDFVFSGLGRSLAPFAIALLAVALLPSGGDAAITITGFVTPNPIDPSDPTEEIRIGDNDLGDPDDFDPRASVIVNGGSVLSNDQIFVGYDEGFYGRLEVSGTGSAVLLDDGGANSDAALEVGRQGNGYFSLTDGATLNLTNSSSDLVVGSDAGSMGEVLLDGASTFATLREDILVGDAGIGRMTISGGALVRTTENNSLVSIGDKLNSSGVLSVKGPFTTLQLGHNLTVARLGIGELNISGGALVDADNSNNALATVGALGKLTLSNGTLNVRYIDVGGYLGGAGVVRGIVNVLPSGFIESNAGQLLDFHDEVINAGAVTISGGEVRFLEAMANNAPGRITLENSVVRFSEPLTNDGVIASAEGTNNIHGAITNNGTVVVASESVAVFNDNYTDAGTTTILPRGNALFLSNLTFTSASLVSLALGAEDGSSQIQVSGAATLAGSLSLNIDPSFTPTTSQSIELIHADGGVTGEFIPPIFPNVEGVQYGLVYGPNGLILDVQVGQSTLLDGDYNSDGVVDAADYTVLRDGFGVSFFQQDYDIWRANYGRTSGEVIAAPQSAPSPSSLACLLAASVTLLGRRRRAAHWRAL